MCMIYCCEEGHCKGHTIVQKVVLYGFLSRTFVPRPATLHVAPLLHLFCSHSLMSENKNQ